MPGPLAGERIRTARHLFGVSQVELAEATPFSQTLISMVESGTKAASAELVAAVALATSLPPSFFDVEPPDLPLGSLRFRKNLTAPKMITKRAEALFTESFRVASALARAARYPTPNLPLAGEGIDGDAIEDLASQTRLALQIAPDGPVPHLTRALERAGIAVGPLVLPSLDDFDDEQAAVGHFGISFWPGTGEHGFIGTFVGGPGDRQRFTIGHELGHVVLHSRRRAVADPEGEAHRFAGALLVPADRMRKAFRHGPLDLEDYLQMKAHWGVSVQALILRATHLGLIGGPRKTSLFKQIAYRRWTREDPVRVGFEEPMLLWKLLERQYGGWNEAQDGLALSAMILRSLIPKPTARARSQRHLRST